MAAGQGGPAEAANSASGLAATPLKFVSLGAGPGRPKGERNLQIPGSLPAHPGMTK